MEKFEIEELLVAFKESQVVAGEGAMRAGARRRACCRGAPREDAEHCRRISVPGGRYLQRPGHRRIGNGPTHQNGSSPRYCPCRAHPPCPPTCCPAGWSSNAARWNDLQPARRRSSEASSQAQPILDKPPQNQRSRLTPRQRAPGSQTVGTGRRMPLLHCCGQTQNDIILPGGLQESGR